MIQFDVDFSQVGLTPPTIVVVSACYGNTFTSPCPTGCLIPRFCFGDDF